MNHDRASARERHPASGGGPANMTVPCLHCGLPLHFEPGLGWLHPNGERYITKDGRDDHVATPDRRAS